MCVRRVIPMIVLLALCCGEVPAPAQQQPSQGVQRYETAYYIMHTDLEPDGAQEAAIRMTKMAEEYYERTKEFSGQINRKFPFYLYRRPQDYLRAGGIPGSSGFFDGNRLVAIASDRAGRGTWHVVQHE